MSSEVARVAVRAARPADEAFLWSMLAEAAAWQPEAAAPTSDELRADDHLARYLEDWGRAGDLALVASASDVTVGAAWVRLFPADRAGYGFLEASTPELSIGVAAGWRGRRVGTMLLAALIEEVRAAGHPALSLSVEPANPARRLYARLGFADVRTEGGAVTMRLELGRRAEGNDE